MRNSLLGTIDKELLLLTPPKKSGAEPHLSQLGSRICLINSHRMCGMKLLGSGIREQSNATSEYMILLSLALQYAFPSIMCLFCTKLSSFIWYYYYTKQHCC
jgi:hypothetical protein